MSPSHGLQVPEWHVGSCHHGWVRLRQMQEVTLTDPRRPGFLPASGWGQAWDTQTVTELWRGLAEAAGQNGAGLGVKDMNLPLMFFPNVALFYLCSRRRGGIDQPLFTTWLQIRMATR